MLNHLYFHSFQPAQSINPRRKYKTGIYVAFVFLIIFLVMSFVAIAVLSVLLFHKKDETIKGQYKHNYDISYLLFLSKNMLSNLNQRIHICVVLGFRPASERLDVRIQAATDQSLRVVTASMLDALQ